MLNRLNEDSINLLPQLTNKTYESETLSQDRQRSKPIQSFQRLTTVAGIQSKSEEFLASNS